MAKDVTDFLPGDWVIWKGRERGRVKRNSIIWVHVVFSCGGQWDRYQDFTGQACDPNDLEVDELMQSTWATIAQQAAWLEAFRQFVRSWDSLPHGVEFLNATTSDLAMTYEAFDAARAAITPEAMGDQG